MGLRPNERPSWACSVRRSRVGHRLLAYVVIGVLGIGAGGVASASLTVSTSADLRDRELRVFFKVANTGNDAVVNLTPVLIIGDQTVSGDEKLRLEAGESFAGTIKSPWRQPGPGRWPYKLAIRFTDADGIELQKVSVSLISNGTLPPARIVVRGLALADGTNPKLELESSDAKPVAATVAFSLSDGLVSSERTVPVTIPAGETRTVESALSGSPKGWPQTLFVTVEYDEDGKHETVFGSARVAGPVPLQPLHGADLAQCLAAVLGGLWFVALPWSRRGAAVRTKRLWPVRPIVEAGAVAISVGFVISYFPSALMFAPTTTNGGDMGTHVYPAYYLREVLLPHGRVSGWCPGTYCGYPLFQFYFFLPFVLMATLNAVVSLAVAFKLVTVLGTVLLPCCAYGALRLARVPFPGPPLAAVFSLPFLFMEANSMWGGNIPSTLAGEFAFSLGMSLAVLALGAVRRALDEGRGLVGTAVLVASVGMAHGYALLWLGVATLAELVTTRGWWRRLGRLTVIHGIAVLLMAFWLLPLLAYAPWTTAYTHVWWIESWQEVVPPVLWPVAIIAVVSSLVVAGLCIGRREAFPRAFASILWATAVGGLFYVVAHAIGVVDIRFLPFMQFGLCLTAATGLGFAARRLPVPEIWPLIAALTLLPFVQSRVTFIPSWISWNYSGFEAKPAWPAFKQLMDRLKGDFRDPRVVYEHSPDHEAVGTIRAFENLPLFSGRSTLEGLYFQGSPTSPFVFYLQSEISQVASCPFAAWGCARFDLDRGVAHMRMMNVSHYIARSALAKEAASRNAGLEHEATIVPYDLYRVRGTDGRYAIPLAFRPVLIRSDHWKELSYQWFKRASPEDVVPVFAQEAPPGSDGLFAEVVTTMPPDPRRDPFQDAPQLREEMGNDHITIHGCTPGHPVLIRISYHPRWTALTGEAIWLAGPSFMLVFPKGEEVRLVFGDGSPVRVGRVLTWGGWLIVLAALLPIGRWFEVPAAMLGRWCVKVPPVALTIGLLRRTGTWPVKRRRLALATALLVVGLGFSGLAVVARTTDADSSFREGQRLYEEEKLDRALGQLENSRRVAPLSNSAMRSQFYESLIYFRKERWREALESFQALVEEFPEAGVAAESQYHVGLCREHLGEVAEAVRAWRIVQQRYPDTPWARYAGDRLKEHE